MKVAEFIFSAQPKNRHNSTKIHCQPTMRNVISPQMQIGQTNIHNIIINVSSRGDIPVILLGLQHIYINQPLKTAVFKILEKIIPLKQDTQTDCFISVVSDKGRLGMDQWSIHVLGTLRLTLNTDYDRVQEHQ